MAFLTCFPIRILHVFLVLGVFVGVLTNRTLMADVVFSEIMYHPVEEPEFDADALPLVSLYDDVFEYIELFNSGTESVSLAGWQINGGIRFEFPTGATIEGGGYLVVARDPDRLADVEAYQLDRNRLWGPYLGTLSNSGERVRISDQIGRVVDAVDYEDRCPWPIAADALGVGERWSDIDPLEHQYRGRSLERVSWSHRSQDAANWLASPLGRGPSPGRPNAVESTVPNPIVTQCVVTQRSDGDRVIAPGQPVAVDVSFSSVLGLGEVVIEYFVDHIDDDDESVARLGMIPLSDQVGNRFAVTLPGQEGRSVVRYRILVDHGDGLERCYPRLDDPFDWRAYFVTPDRDSEHPVYDVFVSRESLRALGRNIVGSPRRVTTPNPPGMPREEWNATEPAVFVHDGIVYDVHIRYHGSRYRRSAGRRSYKLLFPDHQLFRDHDSVFLTDKDFATSSGHLLFRLAGLPTSETRTIDLRLNRNRPLLRLEQEEYNQCMLDRYYRELPIRSPDRTVLPSGALFKCVGNLDGQAEGPFGIGSGTLLDPVTPRRQEEPIYWTTRQRYEYTYRIQNQGWLGHAGFQEMIESIWAAREAENPEGALRAYFSEHWDIEDTLTYLAMINWMAPWDDVTHNYFLWQKRDGRWSMLPWDFDALFGGNSNASASIMTARNFQNRLNIFKDSFLRAFPEEFKKRIWLLNNTLLHPENLARMDLGRTVHSFSNGRFTSVNRQADQGEYLKPGMPRNLFPTGGLGVSQFHRLESSEFEAHANSSAAHFETIWEIRSAKGSFEMPVFRLSSRTQLESLSLPSDVLEPDGLYYWRCTHVDTEGYRSLYSDESSFVFGAGYEQISLISRETEWRYDEQGKNLGTSWRRDSYDDSTWPVGKGRFQSLDDEDPASVRLQNDARTYYFRSSVSLDQIVSSNRVLMHLEAVGGAVVYVNGREVFRRRINRSRPVRSTTFAEPGMSLGVIDGPIEMPATIFREGENLVAIEIHRTNAENSSVAFSLNLDLIRPNEAKGLRINELMAANDGIIEHDGQFLDWVELVNDSDEAIDLSVYSLSDDLSFLDQFRFPAGSRIASGEHLVVWCEPGSTGTGFYSGFRLARKGEILVLAEWRDERPVIQEVVRFGRQLGDRTLSREGDGVAWNIGKPTPGASNLIQQTGDLRTIRINEWTAGDELGADWVELVNNGSLPLNMGGSYLSDQLSNPRKLRFEPNTFLGPGSFFLLGAGKVDGADRLLPFGLNQTGEVILLTDADERRIDQVVWSSQTAGSYHGRLPDGIGIVTSGLSPTPGAVNLASSDLDGDGIPNEYEARFELNAGLFGDAIADLDRDGVSNYWEYLSGTDPTDPLSRLTIRSIRYEIDDLGPILQLSFDGIEGRSYSLQQAPRVEGLEWRSIAQIGAVERDGLSNVSVRRDEVEALGFLRLVTPQVP